MTLQVDTLVDDEEIRAATGLFRKAMVGVLPLSEPAEPLSEPGRTLGVRVDGELVGTATSFTSWLVVPGGAHVPHAAVTRVGVSPTYTRRGVLTAVMRHQLDDIAARGESIATLRASEGRIYERFGYGVATSSARLSLERHQAQLREGVAESGSVRFVDPEAAWELMPRIYTKNSVNWIGAVARPVYWWTFQRAHASEPYYTVVHGPPGAEDGFVRYHPLDVANWFAGSDRTLAIDDFVATTPEARVGLLRHLLAVDLVDTIKMAFAPLDSPTRHLLTDERAVRITGVGDETWLRIVDVDAALSQRSYRDGAPVVVEVTDRIRETNNGRFRISAEGAARVDQAPDISVEIAALGAAYLGGAHWRHLGLAGRAREHRHGALDAADALFATPEQPFSGTFF